MSWKRYARNAKPSKEMAALVKWAAVNGISHRSGLEIKVQKDLWTRKHSYDYEPVKIPYTIPKTEHTYKPDLRLPNGIYIEIKGEFTAADRKKHLYVRECHPHMDLRFVFGNPKQKFSKRPGASTYAQWCDKQGFKWAHGEVPEEWFHE